MATAVEGARYGGTRADHRYTSPGSTVRIVKSPRSGTWMRRATRPLITMPRTSDSSPSRNSSWPGSAVNVRLSSARRVWIPGSRPEANHVELRTATSEPWSCMGPVSRRGTCRRQGRWARGRGPRVPATAPAGPPEGHRSAPPLAPVRNRAAAPRRLAPATAWRRPGRARRRESRAAREPGAGKAGRREAGRRRNRLSRSGSPGPRSETRPTTAFAAFPRSWLPHLIGSADIPRRSGAIPPRSGPVPRPTRFPAVLRPGEPARGAAVERIPGRVSGGDDPAAGHAYSEFRQVLAGAQRSGEEVAALRQSGQDRPDRPAVRPERRVVQLIPGDRCRDGQAGRRSRRVRRHEGPVPPVLGVSLIHIS